MLLARAEYNYYPEEIIEEEQVLKKNRRKKAKTAKKSYKNRAKLLTIGFSIFMMCFGLSILFGYANITKVGLEISELEHKKKQLDSVKLGLIADLEGIKATRKIADEAMYKLGMVYPKESQVVYITVNEFNEASEELVGKKNIFKGFNKVLGLFSSLF